MKVSNLLMSVTNEYNGHKQTFINGISVEQGRQILDELNEDYQDSIFYMVLFPSSEGFSIYEQDYWKEGEHLLGHRDRLILSSEE